MNHHPRVYNANAACAACKHQRKKCDKRCLLSPYFPADKCQEFQAVHRVFGVSNVMKMMLAVSEADRVRLMESLVCEALMRQRDPILGIYGEYQKILDELLYFKTLAQNQVIQLQQLQAEIKRITSSGNSNSNNVGNGSAFMTATPMTATPGLVGWNRKDKMTHVMRESESCIIDTIPYTCGIQNHLQMKNENQEREVVSSTVAIPPPLPPSPEGGFKQRYYTPGT